MTTALSTYVFHGDPIECISDGDLLWVGVRNICAGMGIDEARQREKLKEKSWAVTQSLRTVAADGREREVFCVDLDSLPMWLATIDERRVPEEVRPKLVRYQRECKKALADYFFKKAPCARCVTLEAENRRLFAPSLRPTDIAAAWARAHLEQGKEPMLLRDAWARYVEWSQAQGLPMPLHLSTLSYGLAALFHQSKTRGTVAYYCQLRAQPLPVDLPQRAQQSLPFAAPQSDAPDAQALAERALRLLSRHELPAFALGEILGIGEADAQAVVGPMVEAGMLVPRARGGKVYYVAGAGSVEGLRAKVAAAVDGVRETALADVAQSLGLDADSRSVQMRLGAVLRDLGYERHRLSSAGRHYVFRRREAN